MAKWLEVRRHTANEGDVLTSEGVEHATAIGRQMAGGYEIVVSSGAQRATQAAACFVAGLGQVVPRGVVIDTGIRSDHEDEWRAAYQLAGSGRLDKMREVAPDLVAAEANVLGEALRRILDDVADGSGALVVGHSPTNEAAILGLTGEIVGPLGKGEGIRVTLNDELGFTLERLPA